MRNTAERRIYGIVVVELKGKVDGATAAATERLLDEHSAGARLLVVDLSAVGYVNSAGLRVLLDAGHRHRSFGGRMLLCAVPSYIKEVLDMAGLTSLFPVYATRNEALAAAETAG